MAVCQAAERGGVTAVQLRLKHASPRALLDVARRLRAALRVPVIVNDRPDVARAAGCWVHLGPMTCRSPLPGPLHSGRGHRSLGRIDRGGCEGEEADYWESGRSTAAPPNSMQVNPSASPGFDKSWLRRRASLYRHRRRET